MALLDVTDVLDDPDFTSTYDLYTIGVIMVDGIRTETSTSKLGLTGVVQPAGGQMLKLLPEGAQRSGAISVWTTERLTEGSDQRDADEIVWQSSRYRVMSVTDWSNYAGGRGFVCATCELMQVQPTI